MRLHYRNYCCTCACALVNASWSMLPLVSIWYFLYCLSYQHTNTHTCHLYTKISTPPHIYTITHIPMENMHMLMITQTSVSNIQCCLKICSHTHANKCMITSHVVSSLYIHTFYCHLPNEILHAMPQ